MKLSFKKLWLLAPLAGVLIAVGCQTSVPPIGVYPAPSTAPNFSLANNFDGNFNSQPSTFTNTNLFELNSPNNVIGSPGAWSAPNNFPANEAATMTIAGPGAAGTALACYISGAVTDTGNAAYPDIELDGHLDANPPTTYNAYDGAFFSGVKFYINIKSDDTATYRYFKVSTTQEAEASVGGTCTAGTSCFNYFGSALTGPTNGWQQITLTFSQLTNIATNFQTTPPTFTGVNLQQILFLDWVEGRNNVAGASNVDFGVDEVYFF
jgi:hypothetical protein